MAKYLLNFLIETCLRHREDQLLKHDGHEVILLFSKVRDDGAVTAQLETEAADYRAAADFSSNLILQVLDALAFTTGTPLLLGRCELILKDEKGKEVRRAVHEGQRKVPTPTDLSNEAIMAAGEILGYPTGRPPFLWQRYAYHRQLGIDRFVFQWLAFENLAGDADVPSRCPKCARPGHCMDCDMPLVHRGSDKNRAYEIFASANPSVSRDMFNREIWGSARNAVFHGKDYPRSTFLAKLNGLSEMLRIASEKEIRSRFKVKLGERKIQHYEQLYRISSFIEWSTADPSARFAADAPLVTLAEKASKFEPARVGELYGKTDFKLLDWRVFEDW